MWSQNGRVTATTAAASRYSLRSSCSAKRSGSPARDLVEADGCCRPEVADVEDERRPVQARNGSPATPVKSGGDVATTTSARPASGATAVASAMYER